MTQFNEISCKNRYQNNVNDIPHNFGTTTSTFENQEQQQNPNRRRQSVHVRTKKEEINENKE